MSRASVDQIVGCTQISEKGIEAGGKKHAIHFKEDKNKYDPHNTVDALRNNIALNPSTERRGLMGALSL